MHTKSYIIKLKSFVVIQFGNDTLLLLRSRVLTTSRMHKLVESNTSQQSQPITLYKSNFVEHFKAKDPSTSKPYILVFQISLSPCY